MAALSHNVVATGALTAPFVSLSEADSRALLEDAYGMTGALVRFATEKDDTFRVDSADGTFVLKAGIAVDAPLVAGFGRDTRYFNTFGGNTVAVAAAQATLDVIREEGLLENARAVGARLLAGLEAHAREHDAIGDVRGAGLYIGVEVVTDRESKTPDRATAGAIVNGLRRRRVLISATGEAGNVLKIRPPLVFEPADADRLLETLAAVLGEIPRASP